MTPAVLWLQFQVESDQKWARLGDGARSPGIPSARLSAEWRPSRQILGVSGPRAGIPGGPGLTG